MKIKGLVFVTCLAAGALIASPALSRPVRKTAGSSSKPQQTAARTTRVMPRNRYEQNRQNVSSHTGSTRYYSGMRYSGTRSYVGRQYSGTPRYGANTYYGGTRYYYGGGSYPYYSYYSGWPYSNWGYGTSWGYYPYSYWGGTHTPIPTTIIRAIRSPRATTHHWLPPCSSASANSVITAA